MQTLSAPFGGHRWLTCPNDHKLRLRSPLCASFKPADGTPPAAASVPSAALRPAGPDGRGFYLDPINHGRSYQQQQGMRSAQQSPAGPQPLLGAHPPLKYAQMGHSSYGRGAPHICYMQVGNQGLFYSKAHQEQQQGQDHQPSGWGQLAAHITHAAAGFVQGSSSRGSSLLASAAATGGAAAALPPDGSSATSKQPVGNTTSSSNGSGSVEVKPHWHALVLQALALAAALLVGGLVLKHFFRSVVAALVACYSGLLFKA